MSYAQPAYECKLLDLPKILAATLTLGLHMGAQGMLVYANVNECSWLLVFVIARVRECSCS